MKIFYGDNQFLGVNHSDGKGLKYLEKYKSSEEIAETLRIAWDCGLRDFCFTVNKKTIDAINLVANDCPFRLHPALPYAQRVNELIAEKGLLGGLFFSIKKAGIFSLFFAILKSLFGKYDGLCKILINAELEGIPRNNISSIGLLNVATDFIIGINRSDLIYLFHDTVLKDFKKKPVFYSMNFPILADILWEQKDKRSCCIVFNYNKEGFRTNPNIENIKTYINKYKKNETIAMSLFSGGSPNSLKETLCDVPSLSGVLFGSSNKKNIEENIRILEDMH